MKPVNIGLSNQLMGVGNKPVNIGPANQVSGVGESWWDMSTLWGVVSGDEAKRAEELNKKILDLNADRQAKGIITAEQRQAMDAAILNDDPQAYRSQVGEAFLEGAQEGLQAEQEFVKNTAGAIVSGAAGFVPWWVYAGGALFLANYLGLFDTLKTRGSLSAASRASRRASGQSLF